MNRRHAETVGQLLDAVPAPLVVPGAREEVREAHLRAGRRFVVLDDDPTGSQCVHDVEIVSATGDPLAAALHEPGSTAFVLTNTRSMQPEDAVASTVRSARDAHALSRALGAPVDVVSRGDSTLRGHVVAEMRALAQSRRRESGAGYDAMLLVPAYLEAGRFTVGDVHWAMVGEEPIPVGESEFSEDATFGYSASNLKDYLVEKTGARLGRDDILSISLTDIRAGGPEAVAAVLRSAHDGRWVVVNAMDYADLDVVALAVARLGAAGRSFLYRCGPSFVQALAGVAPRGVLTSADLSGAGLGRPDERQHGLVAVGSHVGLTTRQVAALQRRGAVRSIELDVTALLDPARSARHVDETADAVRSSLVDSDVLLYTSRNLRRAADPTGSLAISRGVSVDLAGVVRRSLAARPAWVVAKGGITSHDVAVRGLSMSRGRVLGQLLPGLISVVSPVDAAPEAVGMPYVVFAGNVGTEQTLADIVGVLSGRLPIASSPSAAPARAVDRRSPGIRDFIAGGDTV